MRVRNITCCDKKKMVVAICFFSNVHIYIDWFVYSVLIIFTTACSYFFARALFSIWSTFSSTLGLEYFFYHFFAYIFECSQTRVLFWALLWSLFLVLSGESTFLSAFFSTLLSTSLSTLGREYFFEHSLEHFFECSRVRVLFWALFWALKKVLSGTQLLPLKLTIWRCLRIQQW